MPKFERDVIKPGLSWVDNDKQRFVVVEDLCDGTLRVTKDTYCRTTMTVDEIAEQIEVALLVGRRGTPCAEGL